MDRVTTGEDLLEERRRRRRAGDPRIAPTGDLMDDFQAALDADAEADPVLLVVGKRLAEIADDLGKREWA